MIRANSIPPLGGVIVITLIVFILLRKGTTQKTYYLATYVSADVWLLILFLRINLPFWFDLTANQYRVITYIFSVVLNAAVGAVCTYWLIFVAGFCHRSGWDNGWKRIVAHIPLAWALIFTITNPIHHLFYTHLELNARSFGPAYRVFLLVVFGYSGLPLLWFIKLAWEVRERVYRKQAVILIIANSFTLSGGIASSFTWKPPIVPNVDLLTVCFVINGILSCYALLMTGFLDVLPIAIREVFVAMADAVLVLDGEARLVQANPPARKVFQGIQVGAPIRDWAPQVGERIGPIGSQDAREFECDAGDSVYWGRTIELRSRAGAAGLLVILTDVTNWKRAEDALRASEERFRSLVQNALDIISILEVDGTIRYESPSVYQILGYRPEEMIGKNVFEFMDPDEVSNVSVRMTEDLKYPGSSTSLEARIKHKDGSWRFLEATGCNLLGNPSVRGLVFNSRDVTERRLGEEKVRRFSRELERSNKELERFAYVASHDLQEPLRKVQTFGDRLKTKYDEVLDEAGKEYISRMSTAASRMQVLIGDLLAYSRVTRSANPFVPVDLSRVVSDVLSDLEVTVEQSRARVEIGELPVIAADPTQMRQLLQNLISNALKFRRKDECPLIRVEGRTVDGNTSKGNGERGSKEFQLVVEDNGIGFEEKYADRIFSPFQRLHGRDEYEGTGIGLAICRSIAERHGGSIATESKPGQGTRFVVTLRVILCGGARQGTGGLNSGAGE
ncbi:MAG TPA: ATP-binding protein [Blastocatellia bacterium]|nr:ATP-binding protein [Blastocatellia bacterium]